MSDDTTIDSLIRAAARAPSIPPGERNTRVVKAGDVIGGTFRIEAELGRGGMGVVYRATDLTLDRQVALKIMMAERWPAEARPHLFEVFDREARATAKLSHPSIVSLYHTGDDNGLLYLVLELLRGESLQARIERDMPSPAEAADIVEQILRGLVHAHEQGILHRDLKPQNVFVCEDGRVRLLDFGLASLQDRAAAKAAAAMSKGGTPSYMAPEQWLGGPQDQRTDVWAVGMILYRMLSHASIVPPASVDALRDGLAVGDIDPGLAEVITRATSYEASDRYASAREMLSALREAIGRSLVSVPSATTAAPARPRRRALLIGAAVLAVAAIGGGLAWRTMDRGHRPVPVAELAGSYRGHFDRLALQQNADGTWWGAYSHDMGFVQAELRDGKLVGWWCETPTRLPPSDAGEFEMLITRDVKGDVFLDGRYRYGRQGQWDETWNMTGTSEVMTDLVPRLAVSAPPCLPAQPGL
jgi:eukaryotic-like serine/threonine-protein kinase